MKTLSKFLHSMLAFCGALVVLASCSMLDTIEETKPIVSTGDKVRLSVEVAEDARVAVPTGVTVNSFDSFTLTATAAGGNSILLGTWQKTETQSAYDVMRYSDILIDSGTYTFVLTGTETYGATYSATLADKVVVEDTKLSFVLSLANLSADGAGSVKITVNSNKTGKVKSAIVKLYTTTDGITLGEYRLGSQKTLGFDSVDKETYYSNECTWEGIPAGAYIALFTYSGDGSVPLGYWPELVYVTAGRTSESTVTLSANQYFTITYNANGGTLTGAATQWYTPVEPVTLASAPTKEGLAFAGWFTSPDSGTTLDDTATTDWEEMTHAGDITLYAKWVAIVSFNANDSEAAKATGTMTDIVVPEGGKVAALTSNAFERTGYVFNKWNTAADGTGTVYLEGASIASLTQNITLYAQWVEVPTGSVLLTFKSNGGSYVDSFTVTSGATIAEADQPKSEKLGYDLAGWFTSEDDGATLSDTAYTFEEIKADVTLYAKWTPKKYSITYLDRDGAAFSGKMPDDAATTHIYDVETVLPVPTKTDVPFLGWYADAECKTSVLTAISAKSYSENITLYARWASPYYVSETGTDAAYSGEGTPFGNGTEEHPYATMKKALTEIQTYGEPENDYVIVVDGKLTERVLLYASGEYDSILTTARAHSLTIRGKTGNDTDSLDGNKEGTVLFIDTNVPIRLENITITGGSTTSPWRGGGVSVGSSTGITPKVTLASGAKITGNASGGSTRYESSYYPYAGGVFVYHGTLTIEDGVEISGNTSYYGGGLGAAFTSSSFVSQPPAPKVIMNGGEISGNKAHNGGAGVYLYGAGTFTMNGGKISDNEIDYTTSMYCGGGVYNGGTFTMNDGEISGNKASYYGGGVYNTTTSFVMNGGTISGNTANDGGAGVFSVYGFSMGGSAYIDSDNLVKVGQNQFFSITITKPLTSTTTPVATVIPNNYTVGNAILKASSGVTLADEVGKFALYNTDYTIATDGTIVAKE